MTLRLGLPPFVRRVWLADMAALERDSRAKHYPAMIEKGEIERGEAEAELAAFADIATLFDVGQVDTDRSWAELILAASRALIRRSEQAEASPDDEQARDRRDAVQTVHDRLVWNRWLHTDAHGPPPFPIAATQEIAA